MKITKTQLKRIIKEEVLNEIGGKQKAHDARLATQMAEKEKKEALVDELKGKLGDEYEAHLKYLKNESRYVVIVYKPADIDYSDDYGMQDIEGEEN